MNKFLDVSKLRNPGANSEIEALRNAVGGDIILRIRPGSYSLSARNTAWTVTCLLEAVDSKGNLHKWLNAAYTTKASVADSSTAGTATINSTTVTFVEGVAIVTIAGSGLKAGSQTINVGGRVNRMSSTGLVPSTTYTATITIDGVAKAISIKGAAAQTYQELITEINTDLGASGSCSLVNGNLVVTSATTGGSSSVSITAGTLFAAPLKGYNKLETAVDGTVATAWAAAETATLTIANLTILGYTVTGGTCVITIV